MTISRGGRSWNVSPSSRFSSPWYTCNGINIGYKNHEDFNIFEYLFTKFSTICLFGSVTLYVWECIQQFISGSKIFKPVTLYVYNEDLSCTPLRLYLKGLGHEMDCKLVDMHGSIEAQNKGRRRFLNFSDAPPTEGVIFIFLAVNAYPTPLDYDIGVYFVKILLLLIFFFNNCVCTGRVPDPTSLFLPTSFCM